MTYFLFFSDHERVEGDARHLLADVWTTAGVVAGLGLQAATGWAWIDPLVAVLVALNILREGGQLIWESSQGLMDAAVEPEAQAALDAALAEFVGWHGAAGGVRVDHVMSRRAGRQRFVSLHLHLPAHWSLQRAAGVRAELEQALLRAVPGLRAGIQMLPLDVEPLEA